ncbi:asparagine synthase C-terminal domain-containing protein [Saccharopolyspora cebuensis]|uniref:Asparagine synthase C-terminal domain-containing protein n=1 Tax=Saccharopolyspora cebuensis TaxID=418759 RepID=A0ABV4CBI6_9PSEU
MLPFPEPEVPWFLVLPDHPDVFPWYDRARQHATRSLRHPSGRPWLLGRWPDEDLCIAVGRGRHAAALGVHRVDHDVLEARLRSHASLDSFARSEPGSFHLIASVDGELRVQGPVLHGRRVVHASTPDGLVLVSDRADVLAWLLGLDVDPALLGLRLLGEAVPHPLGIAPLFTGVDAVDVGHYVVVPPRGAARQVRWWRPPEPTRSLADGAAALQDALTDAVRVRTARPARASCDLAGVDSTAVCGLLAREDVELRAFTVASPDPYDDDLVFAGRTVAALGVAHEVVRTDVMPVVYQDFAATPPALDEPSPISVENGRLDALFRLVAESGCTDHFGGYGGDELLHGSPAWFTSYLRTDPGLALRNLRASRANGRWPRGETARQALDPRSYGNWMRRFADRLGGPPPGTRHPALDWGAVAAFGPWTPVEAVRLAQQRVREASRSARPLSEVRGLHRDLTMMVACSGMLRAFGPVAARHGVTVHAPFYDDRVIEAGLSVRAQDRISRWRYKPLLAEAMRGIVPDVSLDRATKAEGSAVEHQGIVRNRRAILEYFEESRLAELGLLDRRAFHQHVSATSATAQDFTAHLFPSVACEMWLRRLAGAPTDVEQVR